jgi:hypothetical protein
MPLALHYLGCFRLKLFSSAPDQVFLVLVDLLRRAGVVYREARGVTLSDLP